MADDDFTTKAVAGADLPASRVPPTAEVRKAREMTVYSQGPQMPTLRLQGRWLGRAGFPVGARVRVDVSQRRLIVEVVDTEEIAHERDDNIVHEPPGVDTATPPMRVRERSTVTI
jgi:hypothetical protein